MYATCLFCHGALGANESVEHFPVGRRLAFETARGRLWVVCPHCARWNLTPLEERWEAVEECERLARRLRPRAASEQVALLDAPGGLSLVRLGAPTWHELATWRYGARLRMRRRLANVRRGAGQVANQLLPFVVTGALVPAFGWAGVGAGGVVIAALAAAARRRLQQRPVAFPTDAAGDVTTVRRGHLRVAALDPGADASDWRLRLPSDAGAIELAGSDALRIAGLALARENRDGGARLDVDIALRWVAEVGSGEAYIATVARRVARGRAEPHPLAGTSLEPANSFTGPLARLPDLTRLALEVAVCDEAERRALDGELAHLERAWREAEEIAAIADGLFLPPGIETGIARLRAAARGPADRPPT